jgi:hypothetical protein
MVASVFVRSNIIRKLRICQLKNLKNTDLLFWVAYRRAAINANKTQTLENRSADLRLDSKAAQNFGSRLELGL